MNEGHEQDLTRSLGGGGPDATGAEAAGADGARRGAPPVPESLGQYRILRLIGEGGMGAVYEAEQKSPRRTVALKVIRPGYFTPELLRRFELESQVLGRLQHPGIAQIYEAGVFANPEEGAGPRRPPAPIPFFAMEFVRGVPLTEYADSRKLGTRERLELLAKVCDAVYHAHQKGVIHRDLKPSNILVTELDSPSGPSTQHAALSTSAQPKILDFGVARATDSDIQQTTMQTDVGQLIGTVPYMSPEQVGGDPNDLDTRSDVYALGVIAYELLAGRLPHDLRRKMIHEAARIIREEEPTRLSSINRTLRGDVETIVAKALEKEKTRRYQSAESLASDIRRYLKDEPIAARPAGTWYQAAKFAKRNRGLVTGLAAAFVFLAAGMVLALVSREQAIDARDEADAQRTLARLAQAAAEAERDRATGATQFVIVSLSSSDPNLEGSQDMTVVRAMEQALDRINAGSLDHQPATKATILRTISQILTGNGRASAAVSLAERAIETLRAADPADSREHADALFSLAYATMTLGQNPRAEAVFEELLAMNRRLYKDPHPDIASALGNLATVRSRLGKFEDAAALYTEALAMNRRESPPNPRTIAATLVNLANTRKELGNAAEALSLVNEAIDAYQSQGSAEDPNLATMFNARGVSLKTLGRHAEAAEAFRRALEIRERVFHGDHHDTAIGLINLAEAIHALGRSGEAEGLLRDALAMLRRLFKGDHPQVATALGSLAQVVRAQGRASEALPLYEEALEMRRRLFPGDHLAVAQALGNVALAQDLVGRSREAATAARESLDMKRRLFPGDHPETATSMSNLANIYLSLRQPAEAEPLLSEAMAMSERIFEGDHPTTAECLNNLASARRQLGRVEEAERLYVRALAMHERLYAPDHPKVAMSLNNLAFTREQLGDLAGAEPLYERAVAASRAAHGGDHPAVAYCLHNLGRVRLAAGRTDEGEALYRQALDIRRRTLARAHPDLQTSLGTLAELLDSRAEFAGAEGVWREMLAVRREVYPPGDWRIANTLSYLGASIMNQGRYAEAEPLLIEGYEGLVAAGTLPPSRRDRVDMACERLVVLYDSWHKAEPGKGHELKAAEWTTRLNAGAAAGGK